MASWTRSLLYRMRTVLFRPGERFKDLINPVSLCFLNQKQEEAFLAAQADRLASNFRICLGLALAFVALTLLPIFANWPTSGGLFIESSASAQVATNRNMQIVCMAVFLLLGILLSSCQTLRDNLSHGAFEILVLCILLCLLSLTVFCSPWYVCRLHGFDPSGLVTPRSCLTCDELDPYVDVNVAACSTDIQALDVRLLRIENDFVSAASQRIADRHELFRLIDIFENEVAIAAGQRAMDRELLDRCASLLESIEDHGSRKNSMNDIGSVACCDNSMDQTVSVFANSLAPVRSNDCSDISTGLLASSCSDTSTGLLASSIEASAVDRMTLPSPSLLGASALQQDKGRPVKRLKVGLPENAQRGFVGRTSLRASTCSRAREEADAETANVVPLSIAI
eukprot:TRINITY_DN16697_c0_g1_i3.p1 TRINITY_DN16697_c0_g1~~TRINITY_DN16697_c0_g1_i3.p1  ORF type:complete len:396 (+),score=39.12 TRINITY_DN16697_c0_g1_i3:69-1256(+)